MNTFVASAALFAADKKELTEQTVRPGLIGLFFFVALFVATYFLWRSMNKQLKRVDAHFSEDVPADAEVDSSTQDQIAREQAELGRLGRQESERPEAVTPADNGGVNNGSVNGER